MNDNEEEFFIPEGIKRQLRNSPTEPARIIKNADKDLLRNFLLGLDCDTEWDNLPSTVRGLLLKRFCGEPCFVSQDQLSWMTSRFCKDSHLNLREYVAQCNLGATLTIVTNTFAGALHSSKTGQDYAEPPDSSYENYVDSSFSSSVRHNNSQFKDLLKLPFYWAYQNMKLCIKFTIVALVADPEYQRELDYLISDKPFLIRWPVTSFLNGAWMFCKLLQQLTFPLFLVCILPSSPEY